MQGSRFKGSTDDVRTAGDTGEPEVKPSRGEPLISKDWGAVVGALITAAASLLIYSFNQIRHIDERLDLLEKEASALLDGAGVIKPSREALENKYHLEALQDRIERLERHSQ